MENYVLSGCSTADLTMEDFKTRNISCLNYHFSINDVEYIDDMGETLPFSKFYQMMRDGAETKTWQINSSEFCEYFRPFLEAGKNIMHVTLSSGLSGVYNSALLAAEELSKEFPDRKIYIVDSLGASSGYGLLLIKMAELRDKGMSAADLYNWAVENRLKVRHEFFSTDLTFYIKGGRISKTSGMVGTLLGICPLLDMNNIGKLVPRKKVRTKKKVMSEIVSLMEQRAVGGTDYSDKCFICHSDCLEDAEVVKALLKDKFKNIDGDINIYNIGTTIGSHSGPGTLAIFYFGSEREE